MKIPLGFLLVMVLLALAALGNFNASLEMCRTVEVLKANALPSVKRSLLRTDLSSEEHVELAGLRDALQPAKCRTTFKPYPF